jgi:hypothetical protein
LYAFRESGEVVCTVRLVKAPNTDWEDIAIDAAGNLYVGDIGNNKGVFGARYIYVLPEPDPHATPSITARWTQRLKFKYPQKRFNAECLFVLKDRIYITSSELRERPMVYRLDPKSDTECQLVRIEKLPVWLAQGADTSLDETKLVVCTRGALWVLDIDENAQPVPDQKPRRVTFPPSSAEACCFDGGDVLVLTERGKLFRITEAEILAGTSFRRPPNRPATRPASPAARKDPADAE